MVKVLGCGIVATAVLLAKAILNAVPMHLNRIMQRPMLELTLELSPELMLELLKPELMLELLTPELMLELLTPELMLELLTP
jgi:hypothetical protein